MADSLIEAVKYNEKKPSGLIFLWGQRLPQRFIRCVVYYLIDKVTSNPVLIKSFNTDHWNYVCNKVCKIHFSGGTLTDLLDYENLEHIIIDGLVRNYDFRRNGEALQFTREFISITKKLSGIYGHDTPELTNLIDNNLTDIVRLILYSDRYSANWCYNDKDRLVGVIKSSVEILNILDQPESTCTIEEVTEENESMPVFTPLRNPDIFLFPETIHPVIHNAAISFCEVVPDKSVTAALSGNLALYHWLLKPVSETVLHDIKSVIVVARMEDRDNLLNKLPASLRLQSELKDCLTNGVKERKWFYLHNRQTLLRVILINTTPDSMPRIIIQVYSCAEGSQSGTLCKRDSTLVIHFTDQCLPSTTVETSLAQETKSVAVIPLDDLLAADTLQESDVKISELLCQALLKQHNTLTTQYKLPIFKQGYEPDSIVPCRAKIERKQWQDYFCPCCRLLLTDPVKLSCGQHYSKACFQYLPLNFCCPCKDWSCDVHDPEPEYTEDTTLSQEVNTAFFQSEESCNPKIPALQAVRDITTYPDFPDLPDRCATFAKSLSSEDPSSNNWLNPKNTLFAIAYTGNEHASKVLANHVRKKSRSEGREKDSLLGNLCAENWVVGDSIVELHQNFEERFVSIYNDDLIAKEIASGNIKLLAPELFMKFWERIKKEEKNLERHVINFSSWDSSSFFSPRAQHEFKNNLKFGHQYVYSVGCISLGSMLHHMFIQGFRRGFHTSELVQAGVLSICLSLRHFDSYVLMKDEFTGYVEKYVRGHFLSHPATYFASFYHAFASMERAICSESGETALQTIKNELEKWCPEIARMDQRLACIGFDLPKESPITKPQLLLYRFCFFCSFYKDIYYAILIAASKDSSPFHHYSELQSKEKEILKNVCETVSRKLKADFKSLDQMNIPEAERKSATVGKYITSIKSTSIRETSLELKSALQDFRTKLDLKKQELEKEETDRVESLEQKLQADLEFITSAASRRKELLEKTITSVQPVFIGKKTTRPAVMPPKKAKAKNKKRGAEPKKKTSQSPKGSASGNKPGENEKTCDSEATPTWDSELTRVCLQAIKKPEDPETIIKQFKQLLERYSFGTRRAYILIELANFVFEPYRNQFKESMATFRLIEDYHQQFNAALTTGAPLRVELCDLGEASNVLQSQAKKLGEGYRKVSGYYSEALDIFVAVEVQDRDAFTVSDWMNSSLIFLHQRLSSDSLLLLNHQNFCQKILSIFELRKQWLANLRARRGAQGAAFSYQPYNIPGLLKQMGSEMKQLEEIRLQLNSQISKLSKLSQLEQAQD